MKPISEMIHEKPIFSIEKDKTVAEAARFMTEKKIGALPVVERNQLVGIFSERDVITRVIAKGLDPAATTINEVMTTNIVVANTEEGYESCLKKMQLAHCRHMPIVSGEQLVGFVSLRDLLMIDLDEKERNLEYLHSYIYTVPPGSAKKYESNS